MKTILCVDDDPGILRSVGNLLKVRGYHVLLVDDPTQVQHYLETNNIDLIILDVQMPEKSGLDVFDEVKVAYNEFPILFLTGYPPAFHLDEPKKIERWKTGFTDGRTDILYKPFVAEDFYEKIESLIAQPDAAAP